jgi:xanthine dehydrogenase YagS FAD-binding subunit
MKPFEYASPTSLAEAVELLAERPSESAPLAGGTDLLALMKDGVYEPKRLVSVKSIAGLELLSWTGEELTIGAAVKLAQLADDQRVRKTFPALAAAIDEIASPQLRNTATVGGNLCQRPRCWYYRAGFGLLARGPDGRPLPLAGDNRYHAIFHAGQAYFVCPSSLGAALVALDATVRIVGPAGERTVPAAKFFRTPSSEDEREHAIGPNELLTEVVVPIRGYTNAAYEVRQRQALDWPLASAFVAAKLNGEKVTGARIVLGHVAPVPWRATDAEKVLVAGGLGEATIEKAAAAAVKDARPLSRNAYKVNLARTCVKRALQRLAKSAS